MRQNEGRSAKLNETCRREKRREEKRERRFVSQQLLRRRCSFVQGIECPRQQLERNTISQGERERGREGEREGELSVQGTATECHAKHRSLGGTLRGVARGGHCAWLATRLRTRDSTRTAGTWVLLEALTDARVCCGRSLARSHSLCLSSLLRRSSSLRSCLSLPRSRSRPQRHLSP